MPTFVKVILKTGRRHKPSNPAVNPLPSYNKLIKFITTNLALPINFNSMESVQKIWSCPQRLVLFAHCPALAFMDDIFDQFERPRRFGRYDDHFRVIEVV